MGVWAGWGWGDSGWAGWAEGWGAGDEVEEEEAEEPGSLRGLG